MTRVKIQMEFILRASPAIIYRFLTTPSAIVRWFCDEVDITGEIYTFTWSGADEQAEMLDDIEEERIRFRWLDADDPEEYLEYKMYKSNITNETILEITDFCDDDEVDEQRDLWETQVQKLKVESGG